MNSQLEVRKIGSGSHICKESQNCVGLGLDLASMPSLLLWSRLAKHPKAIGVWKKFRSGETESVVHWPRSGGSTPIYFNFSGYPQTSRHPPSWV